MQYFSQDTTILQREGFPTLNHVIPVVDSLERRFEYLLKSVIHQAATALDPRVKLSFTDHHREGKVFVFSSSDVKLSIKSLLPPDPHSTYAGNHL